MQGLEWNALPFPRLGTSLPELRCLHLAGREKLTSERRSVSIPEGSRTPVTSQVTRGLWNHGRYYVLVAWRTAFSNGWASIANTLGSLATMYLR